ncbi:alpha-L-rhamnosidase C-terminal domain-containing protein [Streptomyces collinus]|uniref:alpha-L-rhamnosidase C-terminal domain-containing protein n=1 Tax=Streptomyces collinus TaxID=42684 RepID=UPI00343A8DF6
MVTPRRRTGCCSTPSVRAGSIRWSAAPPPCGSGGTRSGPTAPSTPRRPGRCCRSTNYAYGAVAAWLYGSVAGLRATSPGYRAIEIAPRPGSALTSAGATIATPYGTVSVAWSVRGDTLTVDAQLPPGTTGRFLPPEGLHSAQPVTGLGSGRHRLVLRGCGGRRRRRTTDDSLLRRLGESARRRAPSASRRRRRAAPDRQRRRDSPARPGAPVRRDRGGAPVPSDLPRGPFRGVGASWPRPPSYLIRISASWRR